MCDAFLLSYPSFKAADAHTTCPMMTIPWTFGYSLFWSHHAHIFPRRRVRCCPFLAHLSFFCGLVHECSSGRRNARFDSGFARTVVRPKFNGLSKFFSHRNPVDCCCYPFSVALLFLVLPRSLDPFPPRLFYPQESLASTLHRRNPKPPT